MHVALLRELINNASGMHITIKAWQLWRLHPLKGGEQTAELTRGDPVGPPAEVTEVFTDGGRKDIVAPLVLVSHPR